MTEIPQAAIDAAAGTILDCGCEVGRFNLPCEWHTKHYGEPRPDCGDCRFGVTAVLHECGKG